jgi:hypothetical protein
MIMKKFLFIPVVLILSLLFVSCEKELSFENGGVVIVGGSGSAGGTAKYSFNGGTSSCTGAVLSGTFTAGTAVTSANKVVLQVTVDSIGTYTVSTSSLNGVSFSGSGTFTTTGIQTITLTATGTPAAAGDFNFTAGAAGCVFSVTVAAASGGGGGGNGTDYIRCSIDGTAKTFNDPALGLDIFGTMLITGIENSASANTGNFSITLSNTNPDSVLIFTPGVFLNVTPLPGKTCLIAYIPDASGTGTGWGSATAGQVGGFTVTVTSVTTSRLQGTFSGTLYDNDGNGTNTKTVTGGEFSVPK